MSRAVEIVLQHGWGFDSSCFQVWLEHLSGQAGCEILVRVADRGYYGAEKNVGEFARADALKVVLAHSFGLQLLPEQLLQSADLLVLASAFRCFHAGSNLEQRRSRKTVQMMLKRLEEAPLNVLNEFFGNCSHPDHLPKNVLAQDDLPGLNLGLLAEDLARLNADEFRLERLAHIPEILIVHGNEDRIVPEFHARQLNEKLPQSTLRLFEAAGHSFVLSQVAAVWGAMKNALENFPLRASLQASEVPAELQVGAREQANA